jgi:hypothetical protein
VAVLFFDHPLLFYPAWNLGMMTGAPAAIVAHEMVLRKEAMHRKGQGKIKKKTAVLMTVERPSNP